MYKKYVAMGDSITDKENFLPEIKRYYEWLSEWLKPKELEVLGVSGSTISDNTACMIDRINLVPKDCDLLTIYGGINDFGLNVPLGYLGDKNKKTFFGSLYQLFYKVMSLLPKTQIYFISHVHIGNEFFPEKNSFGFEQNIYEKAIHQMTNFFSIPHISLYCLSGINFFIPEMANLYSLDTLHPNSLGNLKIAQTIYNFIRNNNFKNFFK